MPRVLIWCTCLCRWLPCTAEYGPLSFFLSLSVGRWSFTCQVLFFLSLFFPSCLDWIFDWTICFIQQHLLFLWSLNWVQIVLFPISHHNFLICWYVLKAHQFKPTGTLWTYFILLVIKFLPSVIHLLKWD